MSDAAPLGIDPNLTADEKIDLWKKQCDLKQAQLLYSHVPGVTLYPPDADLKVFNLATQNGTYDAETSSAVTNTIVQALGAVEGTQQSK